MLKTGPAACRKRFANISLITDPISFLIQEANKNCWRPEEGNRNASR